MHMTTLKELLEGKWCRVGGKKGGRQKKGTKEYATEPHVVCASHAEINFCMAGTYIHGVYKSIP